MEPDDLDVFIANACLKWEKDRKFRAALLRELEPTIAETLRRRRAA